MRACFGNRKEKDPLSEQLMFQARYLFRLPIHTGPYERNNFLMSLLWTVFVVPELTQMRFPFFRIPRSPIRKPIKYAFSFLPPPKSVFGCLVLVSEIERLSI